MFGKILLVFTTVSSVLLAGVSIVAFFAVPNMDLAMKELPDYTFEPQFGNTVTWSVTHRLGDKKNVASGVTVFEAVLDARDDLKQTLQKKSGEMTDLLSTVDKQLQSNSEEQELDVEAMTRRGKELDIDAVGLEQQIKDESVEFQDLSVKARVIRDETAGRREDVARLRAELEELRTHQFELRSLRRTLMDQFLRIRLNNQTLEQREDQIRQQLAS